MTFKYMLSVMVASVAFSAAAPSISAEKREFYDPVVKQIEGWTVKVDPRLLDGEGKQVGDKAFRALANHLQRVEYIVPADRLAQLRKLPIWIELNHAKTGSMQFHPDRGWLCGVPGLR